MSDELPELSEAFGSLLDEVRAVERRLLEADPPLGEADVLDGYRWALSLLRVAAEAYIWGDAGNPILVDVIGPYLKWGGDNSDAFYQLAPIEPGRSYRVTGNRGDAVYLSMTVYGGPDDGRYSDRIVDTINDRDLAPDADGNFEFVISAQEQQGNWLKLEPDAVFILTRDYLTDPGVHRRVQWQIEPLDDIGRRPDSRVDLSRRMRAARTWIREQAAMAPVRLPANVLQEPYPVPSRTVGWAAGDAAYSMGAYDLQPGQALVIEGTSPECVFWNLCLWNPFLHTYDYTRERVTINGAHVSYAPDGSWQIVISDTDPGHPNWVSTAGRSTGLIWLRWFLPEATPDPLTCRVIDVAELAS
ncbi:hypothetical protein BST33_00225 [Mycolicibacter minnesotensis]|uniref:Uncharacterized protein n=1 Tax=Mycolicibacter minnesotensis TaxID=1118379 RepID=A0A7I7R8F7_9MYCO|nr:DUF1214 domain-containing protein [Mycolicibacter minnesotensis]ORB04368.1 hypothetical protein BST33_00225 [Mycolicibacter minnesotensis]BBY34945.1 hypothetical protein MMIN_30060 [Mycolicibacter minnesotensis]